MQGASWMDHEFSTDSLAPDEVGWDWLSIQLNDNTELMLYRLRHKDGTADPYSSGTYIDAEGAPHFLARTISRCKRSTKSGRARSQERAIPWRGASRFLH